MNKFIEEYNGNFTKLEMSDHQVVSALILNETEDKVLVEDHIKCSMITFPIGKVEPGEDLIEALKREIKEELDCNIIIEKFITTINYEYNTFLLTMHVYLCHLKDNEPILLEHKASLWCDKDKLETLDFAEADRLLLKFIK